MSVELQLTTLQLHGRSRPVAHGLRSRAVTRELLERNMSTLKRKRGGRLPGGKKAKKVKTLADTGEPATDNQQEKKDEFTIPPPVSMVRD